MTLTSIRDFLRSFYDATKSIEGRQCHLDAVLPIMDFLHHIFEEGLEKYRYDEYMSICIDAGWKRLTEYYRKADRAPAYIAAIVLDPTKKWSYFRDWDPELRNRARRSLRVFWEGSYKSSTGLAQKVDDENPMSESSNLFLLWLARKQAQSIDNLDELEQYTSEPRLVEVGSVMSWWTCPAQRSRFPLLSAMAIDIFSIPAMSSEAERVFSGVKHTISDERASLHIDTIEALECLKSWFRANIFTQEDLTKALQNQPRDV